jgi:hypothetical protein
MSDSGNPKPLQWCWDEKAQTVKVVSETPLNVSWSAKVKLRSVDVMLHLYYVGPYSHCYNYKDPGTTYMYSSPILKSNLQKAVRRKTPAVAMATTRQLLVQNLSDLLRRLPIIMIEDVRPRWGMAQLMWLMIAQSKDFTLQPQHYDYINGAVEQLSVDPVQELPLKDRSITLADALHGGWTTLQKFIGTVYEPLAMALWLRIPYGGMTGDMLMLFCTLRRLDSKPFEHYGPTVWVPPSATSSVFESKHMLSVAVDFHCTNIALSACRRFGVSKDEMRSWMWIYRSGVNLRTLKSSHPSDNPHQGLPYHVNIQVLHEYLNEEAISLWFKEATKLKRKPTKKNHLITEFFQ